MDATVAVAKRQRRPAAVKNGRLVLKRAVLKRHAKNKQGNVIHEQRVGVSFERALEAQEQAIQNATDVLAQQIQRNKRIRIVQLVLSAVFAHIRESMPWLVARCVPQVHRGPGLFYVVFSRNGWRNSCRDFKLTIFDNYDAVALEWSLAGGDIRSCALWSCVDLRLPGVAKLFPVRPVEEAEFCTRMRIRFEGAVKSIYCPREHTGPNFIYAQMLRRRMLAGEVGDAAHVMASDGDLWQRVTDYVVT